MTKETKRAVFLIAVVILAFLVVTGLRPFGEKNRPYYYYERTANGLVPVTPKQVQFLERKFGKKPLYSVQEIAAARAAAP